MRWIRRPLALYVITLVAILVAAALAGSGRSVARMTSSPGGASFAQLEADRLMTQTMAVESVMGESGMLQRTADPAYVQALEQYVSNLDRMMGRLP